MTGLRSSIALLVLLGAFTACWAQPAPASDEPETGLTIRTGHRGARARFIDPDAVSRVLGEWRGLLDPAAHLARDFHAADESMVVALPDAGREAAVLVGGEGLAPVVIGSRVLASGKSRDIDLVEPVRITGRALDATGKPVVDVRVLALQEPTGTPSTLSGHVWLGFTGRTDREGRFTVEGLPMGPFIVAVEAGAAGTLIVEDVWPREEPLELEMPAPATLGGTVMSEPEGDPIEGAEVRLEPFAARSYHGARSVLTDAEGRWNLTGLPETGFSLSVSAPGFLAAGSATAPN